MYFLFPCFPVCLSIRFALLLRRRRRSRVSPSSLAGNSFSPPPFSFFLPSVFLLLYYTTNSKESTSREKAERGENVLYSCPNPTRLRPPPSGRREGQKKVSARHKRKRGRNGRKDFLLSPREGMCSPWILEFFSKKRPLLLRPFLLCKFRTEYWSAERMKRRKIQWLG